MVRAQVQIVCALLCAAMATPLIACKTKAADTAPEAAAPVATAAPRRLRLLGSRVPPLGRSPLRLDRWPLGSSPWPHLESRTLGAWFAWSRLDGRRLAL